MATASGKEQIDCLERSDENVCETLRAHRLLAFQFAASFRQTIEQKKTFSVSSIRFENGRNAETEQKQQIEMRCVWPAMRI